MPSMQDIKKRIRAVESTRQITKAMEMVAAARLRRAQQQIESYRPYAHKMQDMLSNLSEASGEIEHPYFEVREVNRAVLVLFASDRGLCGSFNSNLIRRAGQWLNEHKNENPALVLVGKRAWDFFKRRDVEILSYYQDFGGKMDLGKVRQITNELSEMFIAKKVDEISFVYTSFLSTASFRITEMQFLPIQSDFTAGDDAKGPAKEYIFEPNPEEIYKRLLPNYALVQMQMALAESLASEHGTRMIAMGSATKNAGEMIDHLTLVRNKARQATITKELLDIVSGAEALK